MYECHIRKLLCLFLLAVLLLSIELSERQRLLYLFVETRQPKGRSLIAAMVTKLCSIGAHCPSTDGQNFGAMAILQEGPPG